MNKQQFIKDLMDKMTVREKVGQLNQCGNSIYNDDYKVGWDLLREGRIGSFLGIADVEKANEVQRVAVEETRLGIPLLMGFDVIHGFRTTFPVPWSESFSWEPELARRTSAVAAMEAAANGINWIYAPMIDLARDARWGRIVEGAGEDPYLISRFAEARVKGTQGDNLADGKHTAACAKHFVGYGACMGGRDYNTADMSEQTLFDMYLPSFQSAIDAGVRSVMSAFNDLNGEPCTGSKYLLTDVLRGKMGFEGTVVSDAGSCDQIKIHGYTENDRDTAKTAINAGLDVEMCFGIFTFQDNLEQLVEDGEVSMETLDAAVKRVLELKYDLGLFENPYKNVENASAVLNLPESRALALEAAKKSVVMLKNDGVLPLKNVKTALAGPFADNGAEMAGCWGGVGRGDEAVTPVSAMGLPIVNNAEECADYDVIVTFIGEPSCMTGEGKSRTRNVIPEEHMELLRELKKSGKKIVAAVIGGRPLVLTEVCELADAVLFSGALGCEAGNAYKAILNGEFNPRGRLVNTFPTVVGQAPLFYNENNTGKPPVEEFFWTSKYSDAPIKPLFPFGYGLSYTDFEYSDLKLSDYAPKIGDKITVSVNVKNTGERDGDEVVQVYVRDVVASQTRPKKELKGFKKVHVAAGETVTAEIELDTNSLGFHNRKLEYVVEKGMFKLMAGKNAEDFIETEFELK